MEQNLIYTRLGGNPLGQAELAEQEKTRIIPKVR